MKTIVIKFGGTSLDNNRHLQAAIKIVKKRISDGFKPVVVVSAMGRNGKPYATDTLQQLLPETANKDINDFISNCGEMISAAIFASELIAQEIDSKPLTGWQAGFITDDIFGNSNVQEIRIGYVTELLNQNIVPVICGYQGISLTGKLTTFGRGGSEITAVLLVQALKAEKLEVFKDVDGIYTADPGILKDAELIKVINYEELSEITGNGAKVINSQAAQMASDDHIPIGIGNTMTGIIGTVVKPVRQTRIISSITSRQRLVLIRIATSAENRFSEIFPLFSKTKISLDFITVDNCHISFVIDKDDSIQVNSILAGIEDNYDVSGLYSKITLIGSGMTGEPGVMAEISKVLNDNRIPISMATDSYSTISVLIKSEFEISALNYLHRALIIQE